MNPTLKKFLPWIIGAAIAVVFFLLLITGAGESLLKGVLGLLGIGAAAKAAHTVTKARKTITDSTEEHSEATEKLNANQEARADADEYAVKEALADSGPDSSVPEDDARELARAEMERVKMGRRTPPTA